MLRIRKNRRLQFLILVYSMVNSYLLLGSIGYLLRSLYFHFSLSRSLLIIGFPISIVLIVASFVLLLSLYKSILYLLPHFLYLGCLLGCPLLLGVPQLTDSLLFLTVIPSFTALFWLFIYYLFSHPDFWRVSVGETNELLFNLMVIYNFTTIFLLLCFMYTPFFVSQAAFYWAILSLLALPFMGVFRSIGVNGRLLSILIGIATIFFSFLSKFVGIVPILSAFIDPLRIIGALLSIIGLSSLAEKLH